MSANRRKSLRALYKTWASKYDARTLRKIKAAANRLAKLIQKWVNASDDPEGEFDLTKRRWDADAAAELRFLGVEPVEDLVSEVVDTAFDLVRY